MWPLTSPTSATENHDMKRRKSKEELAKELQTKREKDAAEADADASESDGELTDDRGEPIDRPAGREERSEREGSVNGRGSGPGDFTALSGAQVDEVNELFNLINRSGYLTIGSYSVQSDGEGNVAVSLTALTPSSGGAPRDLQQSDDGSGGAL